MNQNNNSITKNKETEKCKITKQSNKTSNKNTEYLEKTLKETTEKDVLKVYIKTLLNIYKNLPNIINILDKIIERNASSLTTTSNIYGNSYLETYNQVNKVINLTDRKDKLLNLYVIVDTILNSLEGVDRKIAVLKFIQNNKSIDISKDTGLTERTIFRRLNSILDKMVDFMINNNWNVKFLKNQIGSESWIEDYFKQNLENQLNKKVKKS